MKNIFSFLVGSAMVHSVFVYWGGVGGTLESHNGRCVRLMTALLGPAFEWLQIKMSSFFICYSPVLLHYFNNVKINCHLKFILRLERWFRS